MRDLWRRYGRAIEAAATSFERYRLLPVDEAAGSPIAQWGAINAYRVGPHWTIPVTVPLSELSGLKAVVQDRQRVSSVHEALTSGVALPPIEVGVYKGGGAWIVDGNHRLAEARKAKRPTVDVRFTFAG